MQQPPRFRKDHNIVAVAQHGTFVAYAGIWHMPHHGVGYVEPVATDPHYRRQGLGRAVVFETKRRVKELGATIAWVGSDQPFYLALGFEVVDRATPWYRSA